MWVEGTWSKLTPPKSSGSQTNLWSNLEENSSHLFIFYTLDKSKVDNGAEIVIKMIMKNSPILNHPEVCGHNLVSQVLWLGDWIFDNFTSSIYIQKFLKIFLVTLDDLYGNATYHVGEL